MVLKLFGASKNVKALQDLCGISTDAQSYKPCKRIFEILKSNELLDNIDTVLSEDFINPLGTKINQTKLLN